MHSRSLCNTSSAPTDNVRACVCVRAHRQQMPARLIKSLRPSSLPRHVCEDQEEQFPTPS